ncbi:hypothetical protein [Streptomyces venezuelae]|uniref:hypothetical protein n=1 Tax=Streptomyces venezuelae TaxID=54571 RepID=UPI00168A34E9|nr:hypothetical protein [Streptomyces venezuelae]
MARSLGVDLLHVGVADREFQDEPVGVCDVERDTEAVVEYVGVGMGADGLLDALEYRFLGVRLDLEGDVAQGRDVEIRLELLLLLGSANWKKASAGPESTAGSVRVATKGRPMTSS